MIVFIIANFISCLAINYVIFRFLSYKYEIQKNLLNSMLLIIISSIFITTLNQLQFPLLNLLLTAISLLIMKVYLFETPIKNNLTDDFVFFIFTVLMDSLCFFLTGIIYSNANIIDVDYFRIFMSTSLLMFFNVAFLKILKKPKMERLPIGEVIIFFTITLFTIFLIYIFSIEYDMLIEATYKLETIFIIVCVIILDLIIFHYLGYINQHYEMKETILLEQQNVKITNQHYLDIRKQYKDTRKLIHDFKNHINVLELAYLEEKFDLADKIKKDLYNEYEKTRLMFDTGYSILDIILNDKANKAKKYNIMVNVKIEMIDLSNVSELDIITIFGNLIDNAIEANSDKNVLSEKSIDILLYEVQNMIIIKIVNSCSNSIHISLGDIKTTKKNHDGIGINSVKKAVNKYSGDFNIDIYDNKCTVLICIPKET